MDLFVHVGVGDRGSSRQDRRQQYVLVEYVNKTSPYCSIAQAADPIQTLEVTVSPSKLDKKKFKSIELGFDIKTANNSGAATNQDQPPNSRRRPSSTSRRTSRSTRRRHHTARRRRISSRTQRPSRRSTSRAKSIISVPGKSLSHVTADLNLVAYERSALHSGRPDGVQRFDEEHADLPQPCGVREQHDGSQRDPEAIEGQALRHQPDHETPPILAGGVDEFKVAIKKDAAPPLQVDAEQVPDHVDVPGPDLSTVTSTAKAPCTQKSSSIAQTSGGAGHVAPPFAFEPVDCTARLPKLSTLGRGRLSRLSHGLPAP